MCGRTACSLSPECILRLMGQNAQWEGKEKYSPSFNVTPGKYQPIILPSNQFGQRVLKSMKWGLVLLN